ncbi:crossover junction endodeoxyribonuclease RuvC [Candidatus Poriferisodalis sp.]|uniref:crossover junction endodeoxyribonuclease RuvC n=1 Tax=Candidatus Poriferisodalis sp. TaxID=3101277 RepID=UPI003B01923B
MFVLGIDPGLSRCGYGVVEQLGAAGTQRARTEAVALGVVRTDPEQPHAARLAVQMAELQALISEFRPSVVAVERVFFQVNARTAIGVAQVAGLAMAVAAAAGLEVAEYTPTQIKQAVAGWGGADKDQMKRMVGQLLALPGPPEPADAADAAAVALCHLSQAPWGRATPPARARVLLPAAGTAAPPT